MVLEEINSVFVCVEGKKSLYRLVIRRLLLYKEGKKTNNDNNNNVLLINIK